MKKTSLNFDDVLYDKVKIIADDEMRNFNQQVAFILNLYVKDYEKVHGEIVLK